MEGPNLSNAYTPAGTPEILPLPPHTHPEGSISPLPPFPFPRVFFGGEGEEAVFSPRGGWVRGWVSGWVGERRTDAEL